jgi:hypothetical protein
VSSASRLGGFIPAIRPSLPHHTHEPVPKTIQPTNEWTGNCFWMHAVQVLPAVECCCSTCCIAPPRGSRRAIAPVVRLEQGHITRHLPPGRTSDVSQTRSPNHTHALCILAVLECPAKGLRAATHTEAAAVWETCSCIGGETAAPYTSAGSSSSPFKIANESCQHFS